ncbi:MAG: translation initiation factor IF-5A [Candidatus Heimdallarchaeota archaeon]|nr:translation initiation factor IF-5A [Candidatus Heimdallarchaeota archaeon]
MSESDTQPIKATQVKVGTHIVYENEVYVVKSTDKSKAGKHGHAKVRMSVENIITGNKKSLVMPGDDKLKKPMIAKSVAQVISINPDSIQLMDQETYEMFETVLPNFEEIGGKLESGDEVDMWMFLGQRLIKRKRVKSE